MKPILKFLFAFIVAFNLSSSLSMANDSTSTKTEIATLGAGCFWCIEAVMLRVEGVEKVVSGYTGGHVENPNYKQITTGTTGHAEVAQIYFDTDKISFDEILEIFWQLHDPTTLNRQGNDVGTQYRSAIYFHSAEQKAAAEKSKAEAAPNFSDSIVTEITALDIFYKAEDYHQNYYNLNSNQPYCRYVIHPKLKKLGLD